MVIFENPSQTIKEDGGFLAVVSFRALVAWLLAIQIITYCLTALW